MDLETYLKENITFYTERLDGDQLRELLLNKYKEETINEMDDLFDKVHSSTEYNKSRWEFLSEKGIYLDCLKNDFESIKIRLEYLSSRINNSKLILDLGSGYGINLVWLAMQNPNCTMIGVDFVKKFIEKTNKRAERYELTNYNLVLGDMKCLPFPDKTFDLVIASHALHEFQTDYEGAQGSFVVTVPEVLRVTKKGGRVTGTLPTDMASFSYVQSDLRMILEQLRIIELEQEKTEHQNAWEVTSFFTAVKK
ncbi:class I SAM-dependent methyltransferase [archaeon]|nr:class I SAM-dependent methyltransferase [archaeon]